MKKKNSIPCIKSNEYVSNSDADCFCALLLPPFVPDDRCFFPMNLYFYFIKSIGKRLPSQQAWNLKIGFLTK